MLKPTFKITALKKKKDYGKFVLEPLPQGYGDTLGNSLRRCLLGSLPGAAITRVKIDGIRHQFSTLPGLKEDMVELILNLKQVKVIYQGKKEVKAILETKGSKVIKAGDIKAPPEVEIINKDLYLATLTDSKSKLKISLWVSSGFGYSPAEERKSSTLGIIPVDASFSPVLRVNYNVKPTRLGRRTDLDKLIFEIWTDSSAKPKEILEYGAKVLVKFFRQIYKPVFAAKEKKKEVKDENNELMNLTVEELDLPTRIANALRRGGFGTVKGLVKVKKDDIAKVKNLGKKSIDIIYQKLAKKGVGVKL